MSHIIKFTPTMDLIANSYLVVTMPFWFIGTLSNLTSSSATSTTCTGLTVLVSLIHLEHRHRQSTMLVGYQRSILTDIDRQQFCE